jgi:hypothetical protein
MKMQHKTFLLLTLLCWNAFSADSVNVSVTGNIVASPCVFNGGNSNLDVNLGNIQATNMVTPDPHPIRFHSVCYLPVVRQEHVASPPRLAERPILLPVRTII